MPMYANVCKSVKKSTTIKTRLKTKPKQFWGHHFQYFTRAGMFCTHIVRHFVSSSPPPFSWRYLQWMTSRRPSAHQPSAGRHQPAARDVIFSPFFLHSYQRLEILLQRKETTVTSVDKSKQTKPNIISPTQSFIYDKTWSSYSKIYRNNNIQNCALLCT